ncbi:MAG: 50S ribosomal protein L30e [Candidatus Thorarchaeota archaeon]
MVKKKTKNVSEKLDLSRKKKKEFDIDTNIKVAMNTGKFLFGKKQVLKHLRSEPFKMIIIANNCTADLEDKLDYHNSLMKDKIYVHRYKGSSWDLGLACAKPYMVSIIGVVQEGDSDLLTLRT